MKKNLLKLEQCLFEELKEATGDDREYVYQQLLDIRAQIAALAH